jgi:hypothetical protein
MRAMVNGAPPGTAVRTSSTMAGRGGGRGVAPDPGIAKDMRMERAVGTERFNLDITREARDALARIRTCMEATSDSEVVRRCILDWIPPASVDTPPPGRHRLHLRLHEVPSRRLRALAEETGLTLAAVASRSLVDFLPLVDAHEARVASGVRSSEPPPFV